MGAKLTKSKSLSISGKTKEQQKDTVTTVENTNDHLYIATDADNKQKEKDKNKKKKESKLIKKSAETKVDKSTNTENCVLPSLLFTEQLVGDQIPAVSNNVSLDANTAQINAGYQSELPKKDVQKLRETCFHNGIMSVESHDGYQQISNKHKYQANNLNIDEDAAHNASVTVVINSDQVHYDEQQQSVES